LNIKAKQSVGVLLVIEFSVQIHIRHLSRVTERRDMTHPFEKVGLGKAPFSCTHVTENVFASPDGTTKAGGCCDYCGTGIRWEFWIKGSVAGAKQFKVGCDCVAKTGWGIEGFEKVRAAHTRARRQAGAQSRRAARQAQIAAERAQKAAERQDATQAWRDANSALVTRLTSYEGTNSFLQGMVYSLAQWGSLTQGQLEAVESCFAVIDRIEAARANSQHIGSVGDKITLTITVERIIVLETQFGTNYITIARDEQGNAITYKGCINIGEKGDINTIKASVKEHTVYNGIKQTVIQRPKII
jgi:hypothetical protein